MSRVARAAIAAAIGALTTRWSLHALHRGLGQAPAWRKANYGGRSVTLLGGPALTAGTFVAALAAPGDRRVRAAVAGSTAIAGVVGMYDDLAGVGGPRGLRGHLGALQNGEVTTGAVKIAGLLGAGAFAALATKRNGLDIALATGVVGTAANLANLFDLRPGRALKVGLIAGLPAVRGAGYGPGAATMGAVFALLPADLAEHTMLGDAGAGALGAAVASNWVATADRATLVRALAVLVALTLTSEAISFSRVIAAAPPLRWLDEFGRQGVGVDHSDAPDADVPT